MSGILKIVLLVSLSGFSWVYSLPSWAECDKRYKATNRVTPVYPRRAASRGLEGTVIVSFTVTEEGAVQNVQVVEANPARIFDRASIRAAEKLTYNPCMVDGVAVSIPDVSVVYNFRQ